VHERGAAFPIAAGSHQAFTVQVEHLSPQRSIASAAGPPFFLLGAADFHEQRVSGRKRKSSEV
jgi:hypothetical protein